MGALGREQAMRSAFTVTAVLVSAVIVAACSSTRSAPPAPTTTTTTTVNPGGRPAISTSTGPVEAVLAISDFSVTEVASSSGFNYVETFTLAEIGGKSGATVQSIDSQLDVGDADQTNESCWRQKIRVEPKGTSDAFKRPEVLSYCAPVVSGRNKAHRVTMVVIFADDSGYTGAVEASADIK